MEETTYGLVSDEELDEIYGGTVATLPCASTDCCIEQ
jgi:hypothetical protein